MTLPKLMNFRKSSKRHLTPHPSFTEIQVANFFQVRQLKVPCHHHHWLKTITSRFLVQIRRKKETLVLTCAVCVFMHVFTKFEFLACNAQRLLPRTISLKPHVDMQNTCTSISHVYSSTDKYNISNGVPDQQYTWQTLYLFIQSLLFAPMNKPALPL